MEYKGINDYELIYLIKDGNEYAFEFLTKKYLDYINYLISKYYMYIDSKDDLKEIGLNVFYKCLEKYNDSFNVKFNSFFAISFRREINKRIIRRKEQVIKDSIADTLYEETSSYRLFGISLKGKYFFSNSLHILIFEECILRGINLLDFSRHYNLKYSVVYSEYKKMIEILKKVVK